MPKMVWEGKNMYDIGIPNAKGGNEMRNLWEALVNLLNQYGQYGAPYPTDSMLPITVSTLKENLYLYTTHLQLSEGTHQIYCVYMFLDATKASTWNTNKLSVVITK